MTAYGGTFSWAQPSFDYGGRYDKVDWFITGDYLQNARGIENPAQTFNALHDDTEQWHGFAIMNAILDPDTRVSVFGGAFNGSFQIPNNPGQTPQLGLDVKGVTNFNSNVLNENQTENTQFGVISLQKHLDAADLQISAFVRNSNLAYAPDPLGDLLFNGIAQTAERANLAGGVQADSSWRINDAHTLRAGFLAQLEHTSFNTFSEVLPVDSAGAQTSDQPIGITDNGGKTGGLYGVYLQDEWRILPALTLNYGLRFDGVNEYTDATQLSPRINAVWKATDATTFHAGYSRYFVPPPFELVSPTSIGLFANTTAAPAVTQDDPVKAERSHYFDVGVTQLILPGFTVGLDGYYKLATNLIDEGQFGAPIILSAFNYATGRVAGVEFTSSYDMGPWSIYGNAAYSRAMGIDITSAQFNFAPDELAYIQQNYIHLDHDQTWTASAGAAYTFNQGTKFATRVSVDLLAQSGLRASTPTVPNGASLPEYGVVNASVVQKLDLEFRRGDRTSPRRAEPQRCAISNSQRHRRRRRRAAISAFAARFWPGSRKGSKRSPGSSRSRPRRLDLPQFISEDRRLVSAAINEGRNGAQAGALAAPRRRHGSQSDERDKAPAAGRGRSAVPGGVRGRDPRGRGRALSRQAYVP